MRCRRIMSSVLAGMILLCAGIAKPCLAETASDRIPVILEQAVHFVDTEGRDVLLEAGSYEVLTTTDRLHIVAGGEESSRALRSHTTTHSEEVSAPIALAIPGEKDVHYLVVLMPSGIAVVTAGTYSGITSRAAAQNQAPTQAQIQQSYRTAQQSMRSPTQSGVMTNATGALPRGPSRPLTPMEMLQEGLRSQGYHTNPHMSVPGSGQPPPAAGAYISAHEFGAASVVSSQIPSVWPLQPVSFQNLKLRLTVQMSDGSATPYKTLQVQFFPIPLLSTQAMAPGQVVPYGGCYFRKNDYISATGQALIDGQGRAIIDAVGWFQGLDSGLSGAGNCAVAVVIRLAGSTGQFGDPQTLTYLPIVIGLPTTYTISSTWSWQSVLTFQHKELSGVGCSGTSVGLPSHIGGQIPTYPVGVLNHNGDLSMAVRSSPLGTDCQFQSIAVRLPNGTRLRSISYSVLKSGSNYETCRICMDRSSCSFQLPSHGGQNFNRGSAVILAPNGDWSTGFSVRGSHTPLLTPDQVIVHDSVPSGVGGPFVDVVVPMWTRLQCGATTNNDHGVRVVLDEIKLDGPPGLKLP